MKIRHINTGKCPKCAELFDRYPGFHVGLRIWFCSLQEQDPTAHISCAGRGRHLQEQYFKQGNSRAHYGESAHNFNLALDIFRLTHIGAEYGPTWFRNVVGRAVQEHNEHLPAYAFKIKWYGDPDSFYFELPHCEVDGWKKIQNLTPVEPLNNGPAQAPKTSHSNPG